MKRAYTRYAKDWDHDHCEFCMAKFSENPENLHEGYTTTDSYHWICEECYQDFKVVFQWTLVGASDDTA